MAGALERANRAFMQSRRRSDMPLSLDEYANFFNYAGMAYPIIQTTLGSIDRERVGMSAVGAYKGSGPVFALVLARMQAFAQTRFQWAAMTGAQVSRTWGTQDLKILEVPFGPGSSTSKLLKIMEVDASLAGNSYIFKVTPGKLSRLRPEFVTIILGSQSDEDHPQDAPDVEIAAFLYTPPSGDAKIYWPNEVAHYAPIPDPYYHFLGQSWLTPVIREIQGDTLATEHKLRIFENAATPNLAIKFDPSINLDTVRQFRDLLEEDHGGTMNAWKTLYLGGGADPVTVGLNFRELDYAVLQGRAESRLATAAGVSPSWVGFAEGLQGSSLNAGNFNAARRRLTDGTLEDLWTSVAGALEMIVPPPPGGHLWCDRNVPVTRDDAADRAAIKTQEAQQISVLIQQGFTPDSVTDAVSAGDWSRLKHTGLTSVQLHEPGAEPAPAMGQYKPPAVTSGSGNGNGNGAGH